MPFTMQDVSIYDRIDKFPSPGHDEELDQYLGDQSILEMSAMHHTGQHMTPPHRAGFGPLHALTSKNGQTLRLL